jgi:hypothetical protein
MEDKTSRKSYEEANWARLTPEARDAYSKLRRARELETSRKSCEEANWARLTPWARDAHNKWCRARGLEELPEYHGCWRPKDRIEMVGVAAPDVVSADVGETGISAVDIEHALRDFGPGDLDQIGAILGVAACDERLQFDLGLAICKFSLEQTGPKLRRGAHSDHIDCLGKNVGVLLGILTEKSPEAEDAEFQLQLRQFDVSELTGELFKLAELARSCLPPADGRPADMARQAFFATLYGLYKSYTGQPAKKPYKITSQHGIGDVYVGSEFMDMVRLCCRPASKIIPGGVSLSNNAIGKLVLKIIKADENPGKKSLYSVP